MASDSCLDKGCRELQFSLSTQNSQMEEDLCGGKRNCGLFCDKISHIAGLLQRSASPHAPLKIPCGALAVQEEDSESRLSPFPICSIQSCQIICKCATAGVKKPSL